VPLPRSDRAIPSHQTRRAITGCGRANLFKRRASGRWLQRFDRSLASEFGTDGFTLLVRSNCGF
jgi:hypothetical protein